mgnify:CR=1 FL=1
MFYTKIIHIQIKAILKKYRLLLTFTIGVIILAIFLVNNSYVQTYLAQKIASQFNQQYGTELKIKTAELKINGKVDLGNFLLLDHKNDTLIYFKSLDLSPRSLKKIIENDLNFSSIDFEGLRINVVKYEEDNKSNIELFVNKLNKEIKGKKINKDFSIKINTLTGTKNQLSFTDQNNPDRNIEVFDVNLNISDFIYTKNDFNLDLKEFNFKNKSGFNLDQFTSQIKLNIFDKKLDLENLDFNFGRSRFNAAISLDYSKLTELSFKKIKNLESLYIDSEILNSSIYLPDLNSIYNQINLLDSNNWSLKSKLSGYLKDLNIINTEFSSNDDLIKFDGRLLNFLKINESTILNFNFNEIKTSSERINSVFPNAFGTILPTSAKSLGVFKFNGNLKIKSDEIESIFNLKLEEGAVDAFLKISDFSNIDNSVYEGYLIGKELNISKFLNFKFIGKSNFKFDVKGRGFTTKYLNSEVTGRIENVFYKDFILKNIDIFGQVKDQVFDGKLVVNDENLSMDFNGLVDYTNDLIDFDFNSKVDRINLKNFGLNNAGQIKGDFQVKLRGNNMKDLIGDFTLKNLGYSVNNQNYKFDDLNAQLRKNEDNRIINVSSNDIVSGILIGEYDFLNLRSSIQNNFGIHYENYDSNGIDQFQNISFSLNFKPKFLKLLNNNLSIDENTFLKGRFLTDGSYELNLESSFLSFNNIRAENIDFNITNNGGYINIKNIESTVLNGKDFKLNTLFENDFLNVNASYLSNKNELNRVNFTHTINDKKMSEIAFENLELIINNQNWTINKNDPKLNPKFIFSWTENEYKFENASFKSGNQFIDLNISEGNNNSEYTLNFENFALQNFTNPSSKIFFEALVNGRIELIKKNDIYKGISSLKIDDLKANSTLIGNADLQINASKDLKSFIMDLKVNDDANEILSLSGNFGIEEDFFPLDLSLKMKKFSIAPFSKIGDNVITDFKGYFNSEIAISGNTSKPNFDGFINTESVGFLIPYLNVRYNLSNDPKFILNEQDFKLINFNLNNTQTQTNGNLEGIISHNKFKNWILNLEIDTENLLILDTKSNKEALYFGKAFLNGKAEISGPGESLLIDLNGSTNKNTFLTIPIKESVNSGELSYLNFVSKDKNIPNRSNKGGLKVNLDIDFNENANVEVILDQVSGSRLNVLGNGKLNFKINNQASFNIFGNYSVDSGSYFYKSLGIVDREFFLKKGSTIVWNGDPYQAEVNINANYQVPGGANPAILIQNTSFNRKIPTNVDVNLTGNLMEMNTPNFKINFPNTSGPIKSELEYYLVDDEKTQKQAISLLYQSTFIDEISLSSVSSQAITNNLFQKASGIIDDIFTNSDDKMNIGINYLKGDKNAASSLLNRDRLGLTLKTELSDKILINGKIGVPVSGVEDNVIIGNVQIDFLLNEKGNFRARFFNKENEYQYFANDIGYTQGMGISYEIEFDSFNELFKKRFKENKSTNKTIKN